MPQYVLGEKSPRLSFIYIMTFSSQIILVSHRRRLKVIELVNDKLGFKLKFLTSSPYFFLLSNVVSQ